MSSGEQVILSREGSKFFVVCNPGVVDAWRKAKDRMSLDDVVQADRVFVYRKGTKGAMQEPTEAEIENAFGTTRRDEVIREILENGKPRVLTTERKELLWSNRGM
eukprot:m51a1_g11409 hypothetical protein (105) ;mRNA; r:14464-14848